ncbi:MAG: hypothetical protein JKX94_03680, partial [Sneathiella sp.]|nr:hypothetical protein [Sneathiella sp.]
GVAVSLHMGNAQEILSGLLDFSYDIGIVADMKEDNRFFSYTISKDPLVAFVSKKHPWADRRQVSLKDLSNSRLILREKGSRTRIHVEEEFERAGLKLNIAMEVQGREAAREAVAAEIGIGFVSNPEFGHDTRLIALQLTDCDAKMTESVVCLKEKLNVRTVKAFLNCNNIPPKNHPLS